MTSKYVNNLRVLAEVLKGKGFEYTKDMAAECADHMERMESTVEYQRRLIKALEDELER